MGKSTAAEILTGWGHAVVDTDSLAREIVAPGEPALEEIRDGFGPAMLRADGTLDRGRMAAVVFGDPAARARLEAILHPRIRTAWLDRLRQWREAGRPLGVVVIPLLFETQAETEFDAVVCVACSSASQLERLRARGWSADEIQRRCGAQLAVEEKIRRSHYLVWTGTPLAEHEEQWRRVLAHLRVPWAVAS